MEPNLILIWNGSKKCMRVNILQSDRNSFSRHEEI